MIGLGTDLVDVGRFRRVIGRSPGIIDRVFREEERAYALGRRDPVPSLAVRFAAKEAVMKALGVGIGGVAMRDIAVVRVDSGEPSLRLHASASALAAEHGISRWLLTLTHTDALAQAIAVAL